MGPDPCNRHFRDVPKFLLKKPNLLPVKRHRCAQSYPNSAHAPFNYRSCREKVNVNGDIGQFSNRLRFDDHGDVAMQKEARLLAGVLQLTSLV